MKIPLNWLSDYAKTDKSPREIAASFTQLGLMLDKPLDDSGVLDLEHRMDRSDWLSILGCARDFAAFEDIKLKYPETNKTKLGQISPSELIEISVKTPHVRRFTTRIIKNIKVGDSPKWLRERLTAYGIKSINNVVDITNYVMVEYGQPMHAQDIAKLKGKDITIRPSKKGEQITTILGTTIELGDDTFILTSGGKPTVIGGIVGGIDTSVSESTTDIILDAGNYDQAVIRKTSRRLKILNETVSRYDKFLDPRLTILAMERATYLLTTLCGGVAYENVDYYPSPVKPKTQSLHFDRLAQIGGIHLDLKKIKHILTSLEYRIVEESKTKLVLEIPAFRTDVEVEDDLVADILRINNYSNLPTIALSTTVPKEITPRIVNFEEKLRDILVGIGAHEHITTSLVKAGEAKSQILLTNALSTDQNALRYELLSNLRLIAQNYSKHKAIVTGLFEIGKVFHQENKEYKELRLLGVISNEAKDMLATLLSTLQIKYQINNQGQIYSGSTKLGEIVNDRFELDTTKLIELSTSYSRIISEFSHDITRDISLIAKPDISYYDIEKVIQSLSLHNTELGCKSFTKIGNERNYLITLTWKNDVHIDEDIKSILKELKAKLNIISKS